MPRDDRSDRECIASVAGAIPNTRLHLAEKAPRALSLSSRASSRILVRSRAGGREPEAAKQPETAEELEELRRPNGRRRPKVQPNPLCRATPEALVT